MGGDRKTGVALDFSKSSKRALEWATNNLLDKGDMLIVLHVMHPTKDESKHGLWTKSGSRKIPFHPRDSDPISFIHTSRHS